MGLLDRLRNHFRQNALSKEIRREMEFHLAERADDLVAGGMPLPAAQREARRKFGSLAYQGEHTRERDLFRWVDTLAGDLRYALRSLRHAPAFSAVAILSLALGIGANTAIFTILNVVMLKSLPVSHPEQLVALVVNEKNPIFTNPLWEAIRDRQDMFSGVLAYGNTDFNLTNGGEARRIDGNWVSGDYFATLGVQPVLGRLIVRADDYRGCPGVAVLGYQFWDTQYARDESAIGKTLTLDGHPFQVIGVADPRFFGLSVGQRPDVYVPLCSEAITRGANTQLDHRSSWFLQIVGRPKPGMTSGQIDARLATLAPAIMEATLPPNYSPEAVQHYRMSKLHVQPADKGFSFLRMQYSKALYMLMAIVALVLLIACANVANLLLARATVRQREMAVRLALGAGRARLVRQLVTESLLLSTIGAALGAAFAVWGSRVLVALFSRGNPWMRLDLGVDSRVLLFTIGVAVLTGLLFGLAPAWRAGRVSPQAAMKAQGRGVAEGHSRLSAGKLLVAGQVALSLVLIIAAGLLLGSWRRLATTDPGFRGEQVLLVNADLRGAEVPPERRLAIDQDVLDRLRSLPGVRSASASQITPVSGITWNELLQVDQLTAKTAGAPSTNKPDAPAFSRSGPPHEEDDALAWANAVSDGYFTTLGVPLLAGRDFDARDSRTAPHVAIVNASMARHFFGTSAAVGRTFRKQEGSGWGKPIEVVGVVGDTKYISLRDSAQRIIYFPRNQESADAIYVTFELRVVGSPTSLVPGVARAIAGVNPRIAFEVKTLDQQLDQSLSLARSVATLSGFFGVLAVLLATIGLYGIMAYTVARRRNEIGVRIALGAGRPRVVRMVLAEVSRILAAGVAIGVALSLGATRLVVSFLYGVKANDPATLIGSMLLLATVGVAAAALPAWRAARLDPVEALRDQ